VPVYVLLIIPACFVLAVLWVLWRGRPERRLGDAASVSEHARRMQALAPPAQQRPSRRHRDR
jgi:hypothetical protein